MSTGSCNLCDQVLSQNLLMWPEPEAAAAIIHFEWENFHTSYSDWTPATVIYTLLLPEQPNFATFKIPLYLDSGLIYTNKIARSDKADSDKTMHYVIDIFEETWLIWLHNDNWHACSNMTEILVVHITVYTNICFWGIM